MDGADTSSECVLNEPQDSKEQEDCNPNLDESVECIIQTDLFLASDCVSPPITSSTPVKIQRNRGKPEFPTEEVILKKCCDESCLRKVSVADISYARDGFYNKSEVDQNQYVLTYMHQHRKRESRSTDCVYVVGGSVVCENAWRLVMGMKRTRFHSLKEKVAAGVLLIEHGRTGMSYTSAASTNVNSWMSAFFKKAGDRMPMKETIHLPSCLSKQDVYSIACDDLERNGLAVCGRSTFFQIWKSKYAHVVIPKEDRFTHCDVCSAIKEARSRTTDQPTRAWLEKVLKEHLDLQMREREKYAKHRRKAQKYPESYLSVIIDGMDQSKTDLPHIITNPKLLAGCHTLSTHVTGVKVHGRDTFMYIDCGMLSHDTNLTLTVFLQSINKYKESLPPVLYIQMDNCSRENKNKTILTFASMLVELDMFRKVKIGFLPVGHTHEDIDQVFSRVSTRLKHTNVLSLQDLQKAIRLSFSPSPVVSVVNCVYDIASWLKPHIPQLHDHLKAHLFKFERNNDGRVCMWYKEWSGDDLWLPDGGMQLLVQVSGNLIPAVDDKPGIIRPSFDDEVDDLQKMVEKLAGYLKKGGHYQWWESWLNSLKKSQCDTSNVPWILHQMCDYTSIPEDLLQSQQRKQDELQSSMESSEEDDSQIPYVGYISTRWVGQRGRANLMNAARIESSEQIIQHARSDLKLLAKTCLSAFEAANMMNSSNSIVAKAVRECQLLTSVNSKQATRTESTPTHWTEFEKPGECSSCMLDHVTKELGGEMVELIDKRPEPPDIYIGPLRGKTTIIRNRDITKELAVGNLVAVNHPERAGMVPQIAVVDFIPENATLDSLITISWMKQEKAPHKPIWMRGFTPSGVADTIKMSGILLYDFQLNSKCKTLKKSTREELQKLYKEIDM